jgi:cold shock CspA family protein
MPSGILKAWIEEERKLRARVVAGQHRRHGFILPDDGGKDVFFFYRDFEGDKHNLVAGDRLQYEIKAGREGRARAVRVRRHV